MKIGFFTLKRHIVHMHTNATSTVPVWSIATPAIAGVLIVCAFLGIVHEDNPIFLSAAVIVLAATVFSAVHHAEILALRVGEPLGSIILAGAVTIIEVALIVSILLSGADGSEVVARDTVFSAAMIVLNGVIGLCLVLGGRRHHEQTFQLNSATSALAILGTLATLVLVLPNFVLAGAPKQYASVQLAIVGVITFVLYGAYLFAQTVTHRDYFMEDGAESDDHHGPAPVGRIVLASSLMLPASLLGVVLLAKILSHPLDAAVVSAGLPHSVVGVVIATLVLLPEGIASVRAAVSNRLQNSINLVLGSALASIGLTIPIVTMVILVADRQVTLGLDPEDMALLILTLFVSTLTLGTGRTTFLQGIVHLGIFGVFMLLAVMP